MSYTLTIWLEIHCKLLTDSKVFCRCRNEQDFDTLPANTHICPVCTGLPWALPTLSKEVVQKAAALGMLIGCEQQVVSHFDRKSYFYPDLPMWYQITQFTKPLNINGKVVYHSPDYSEKKEVGITQAHIECDTAKTALFNGETLLDFNRAWTPLIEIVTTPDFHSADDVQGFIREIQRTLQYYNISLAQMDKWQMRCDVNISVSKDSTLWTKVEIKNMNSISAIKRAIQYEYDRQTTTLDNWGILTQETRWWDDAKWESYTMRTKENALDYRYFPEPDLPPMHFNEEDKKVAQSIIWETIAAKIERYLHAYWFHKEYINWILSDESVTHIFEDSIERWFDAKAVAKYLVNYVLAYTNTGTLHLSDTPFSAHAFFLFLSTIKEKNIPDNIAKQIITQYLETRGDMQSIIDNFSSAWQAEVDIDSIIKDVLTAHQKVVDEYKWGKKTAIGFLIWQVMKKTWGVLQPQVVQMKLEELLN
jgi:aspartyl-tRNA(Asn)/glutamyl-tRNA(Gln) amidotransferase subunit B